MTTQSRIWREGRVVEGRGGPSVRFAAGCDGGCACGLGLDRLAGGGSCKLSPRALGIAEPVRAGDRITVSVTASGLTRVAGRLFALPLVALLAGAWLGHAVGGDLGVDADLAAGLAGLSALTLTSVAAATCRTSALLRPLKLNARLQRTDA